MKTGSFTPRPGELFAWYYDSIDSVCYANRIWSTPMRCYVPSQGTNLLISLTNTDIWWFNNENFIHMHIDDIRGKVSSHVAPALYPRSL